MCRRGQQEQKCACNSELGLQPPFLPFVARGRQQDAHCGAGKNKPSPRKQGESRMFA
jgi:hypothetical protein